MRDVADDAVTALLIAARDGDEAAFRSLFDRLYAELRRLAHVVRAGQAPATLDTTELVHEAYLKLVPGRGFTARDRLHFFRIAARAMRQVLVDAARKRSTARRGAGAIVQLHDFADQIASDPTHEGIRAEDILALDRALQQLEEWSPRQASVVECRIFAGLSVPETARVLNVSEPTVKRDWQSARAWLAHALGHS